MAALLRAWEGGDAVVPVDPRLPRPAAEAVLRSVCPAVLVDGDGERHALDGGGVPVEDGDALVVATSGTTGQPRGVVLTHDAVAASARATSARLGVDPASDRWLACLPLAHVGGLSVVTRALVTGTPLVVHPRLDPAAVEATARGDDPVTLVSLVARSLAAGAGGGAEPLVGAPPARRVEASLFRTVVLGGSAAPSELPANVVCTYGMTETGSGVVYDGIPLPGVELQIGEAGVIRLRGPMLCRGYRDGSAACDAEGWLSTGDAGTWEDGRLVVLGRLSDLIISGGENVWPGPVEEAIATHAGVREVAVAGRQDEEWGERVVAFVVPVTGSAPVLDELRRLVKERLGTWAAPRELVLVDSLPRTSLGKVRRRALVEGAESRLPASGHGGC